MSGQEIARFFDTSGCLNLTRPNSSTQNSARNRPGSIPIRGQTKIDLYNFDHIDFVDSKYVLTSPRSLEACARLNIKPASLLPVRLSDVNSTKHQYSTLIDIRDEMEIERLANLQRCREEREKIIQEESSRKLVEASSSCLSRTENNPKNGVHRATRVQVRPVPSSSAGKRRLPLKTKVAQWSSSETLNDDGRSCSSADLLEDVRRMDQRLQKIGTEKQSNRLHYLRGLENAKQTIIQRAQQTGTTQNIDHLPTEKKQYELFLGHYDHELKIQKARENVRRNEIEKQAERQQTLVQEFLGQTLAEERRQNEIRRRTEKSHQARQLYEALQAKNHELKVADEEKRRLELLHDIERKDRRTEHFVKDKQETVQLCRTIAKSSQDTREFLRENNEHFDEKVRKAELTNNVLVTKKRTPIDRRYVEESNR